MSSLGVSCPASLVLWIRRLAARGFTNLWGKLETHVLPHGLNFFHMVEALLRQVGYNFFDKHFGDRCARRDANCLRTFQPSICLLYTSPSPRD